MNGLNQSDSIFCKNLNQLLPTLFGSKCQANVGILESSGEFFIITIESVKCIIDIEMLIKILNVEIDKIIDITFHYPIQAHDSGINIILKVLMSSCKKVNFPTFNYQKFRIVTFPFNTIQDDLRKVCQNNKTMMKQDRINLEKISKIVYNHDEHIPRVELNFTANSDSTGYILEFNGLEQIKLSFLEYLYNEFKLQISDIHIYGNELKDRKLSIFLKSFKYEILPKEGFQRFKVESIKKRLRNADSDESNNKRQRD